MQLLWFVRVTDLVPLHIPLYPLNFAFGMLKTLMTSYGYLLDDLSPPGQRKAVVLYDRTSGFREGGAGKSILLDGID